MKKQTKEGTATKLDNSFYCPQYAGYLWNNWTGLASLWTNGFSFSMDKYLKKQAKHSQKKSYLDWIIIFFDTDCVINPPRTQTNIELNQKITKKLHVTLFTKTQSIDPVITDKHFTDW